MKKHSVFGLLKSGLAIAGAILLSGCGLEIPNASQFLASCDQHRPSVSDRERASVYFISSALPRCRDGRAEITGFRNLPEQVGRAHYDPDSEDVLEIEPAIEFTPSKEWIETVRRDARAANDKLVVFIHGYNNTFVDAFRRGADIERLYQPPWPQRAENIRPVVMIHWPSRASIVSYTFDSASIAWAQDAIDQRLALLTTLADDITLIAHSMGTRAAIRSVLALDRIAEVYVPGKDQKEPVNPDAIKRIVLASGDVDRDAVMRPGGSLDLMMNPAPRSSEQSSSPRRKILIYSSYRDTPIQASRRVHAYARLGTTSCRYDIFQPHRTLGTRGNCHLSAERPGLTVVSTSTVNVPDRLNHADFLDDCSTRAHFRAWLLNLETKRYAEPITHANGELSGYEIIPGSGEDCNSRA